MSATIRVTSLGLIFLICSQGMVIPRSPIEIVTGKRNQIIQCMVSCAVTTTLAKQTRASSPQLPAPMSSISVPHISSDDGFISGLVSGAVSRFFKEAILHPIDTVRARQQIGNTSAPLYSNLYDGLAPALIAGIPAGALFFGVKDFSKKKLKALGLSKEQATILSVAITNIPYWLLRTPAEVIKTRQQTGYSASSSGLDDLLRAYEEYVNNTEVSSLKVHTVTDAPTILGFLCYLYKSYPSNFAYALPADIVKFVAYETLSSILFGTEDGQKVEGANAAVTGAIAGLLAQAVTTPLDVARTRIMVSEEVNTGSSDPFVVIASIAEKEGLPSIFAGSVPRAVRAIASGAIQFASYELTQNALR